MLNQSHLETWFGLPVEEASKDTDFQPEGVIYRFGYNYDNEEDPLKVLELFLNHPAARTAVAIILGMDNESGSDTTQSQFLELLEKHRAQLPALRGLFLGDIVQEENEMSWIKQDDISQALRLFPALEELRSRGQDGLQFQAGRYGALKTLVIETGGMPKAVLQGLADSEFPALERLELWLGEESYGFDGGVEDVLRVLNPAIFPKLRHLALGNSEIAGELVDAIADHPILDQLEILDLSLGTLTDDEAAPLLVSDRVKKLRKLNLHRNFLSKEMSALFQDLGIEVDTEGQEEPDDDYFYVAVGE